MARTREITTSIEIDAAPAEVWTVLVDFASYPEWNAFLPEVRGEPRVGSRIRFVFELPRGFRLKATAVVIRAEPGTELRWAGRFLLPLLLRAEHYFLLRPLGGNRTLFDHGERFSGLLAPLLWPLLRERGRRVYVDMNVALRARVEG